MRETAPSDAARDYFQFLGYMWDITAAYDIAQALPVRLLPTAPFFPLLPLIRVDAEHAARTDLQRPVLAATVAGLDGTTMLIDGWHRLHRARTEDRTHLPCQLLTAEQEARIRITGGEHPRRRSR